MFVTLIRTVILYIIVIATVRAMGKRQIGELQPTELVITILLSEIVAIPMQDNDLPLLSTVIPVLVLVFFEIVISVISLKSVRFRSALQGNSIVVIRDGKLDLEAIKKIRFTVDDILEALREKDVFDIKTVSYAIIETNGSISVLLKPEESPVTKKDLHLKGEDNGMPCAVIVDGKIIEADFRDCNLTKDKLNKIIKKDKIDVKNTLLLTVDKAGNRVHIGKDQK